MYNNSTGHRRMRVTCTPLKATGGCGACQPQPAPADCLSEQRCMQPPHAELTTAKATAPPACLCAKCTSANKTSTSKQQPCKHRPSSACALRSDTHTLTLSSELTSTTAPAQPPPQRWLHQTLPNLKNVSIPPSTVAGCQQVMLLSREGHRVLPAPPLMNHAAGTAGTSTQNGRQEPRPKCVARRRAEHNKTPRYVCVLWCGRGLCRSPCSDKHHATLEAEPSAANTSRKGDITCYCTDRGPATPTRNTTLHPHTHTHASSQPQQLHRPPVSLSACLTARQQKPPETCCAAVAAARAGQVVVCYTTKQQPRPPHPTSRRSASSRPPVGRGFFHSHKSTS